MVDDDDDDDDDDDGEEEDEEEDEEDEEEDEDEDEDEDERLETGSNGTHQWQPGLIVFVLIQGLKILCCRGRMENPQWIAVF